MTPITWGVVPVKGYGRAKSRLQGHVDRAALAERLAHHVCGCLAHLDGTLVLTDDPALAAACPGTACLLDAPGASLAGVVDRGLAWLADRHADLAVVLMGDLPLASRADVDALLAALAGPPVVAPDRRGRGTNALAVRLPAAPTWFGHPDSLARHLAAGARTLERPGLALDLDLPEDLDAWADAAPD